MSILVISVDSLCIQFSVSLCDHSQYQRQLSANGSEHLVYPDDVLPARAYADKTLPPFSKRIDLTMLVPESLSYQ